MLLEFLELPGDIRRFDTNKQYSILYEKIEVLEKSFFIDDSIIEYSGIKIDFGHESVEMLE